MKFLMNKILISLLLLVSVNLVHADIANELLWEARIDQMEKSQKQYARNLEREKQLELEALLLIDSCKVIEDCIENVEFLKLKTVYDKMRPDTIYTRPNKDQIDTWRKRIQELIEKAKVDNKKAKESHAYLKQNIINGTGLALAFAGMMTLGTWGSKIISDSHQNGKNYLAKYAIDAAAIIGLPVTFVLFLKFILQLIPSDRIETLQKMDSILLLFEQLNGAKS